MDLDQEALKSRVFDLRLEHRALDGEITRLGLAGATDALQLQRLKKRKLALKDLIARMESLLLPDIIA